MEAQKKHTSATLLAVLLASATCFSADKAAKWDLQSRIRMDVCYDETVLPRVGRDRSPVDSMCMRVTPGASLRRRKGRDLLDLRYDLYARMYEELENRDSITHRGRLRWRQTINSQMTLNADERFTYSYDSGGEQDENITRPSTYANNYLKLGLDTRTGTRWRWLTDVAHEKRVYSDHRVDNWYTVDMGLGAEYRVGKTCRLTLRQEVKYLDVEDEETDRTGRTLAGYACSLPWKLTFDARGGVLTFDNGVDPEPAGAVRLSKRWGKAHLSLHWERKASVSAGNSRVVRRDYLTLRPVYRINPETQVLGHLGLVEQKTMEDDYTDTTTWQSSVTVRRKLTKSLSADLSYRYIDQEVRGRSGTPLSGSIISFGISAVL